MSSSRGVAANTGGSELVLTEAPPQARALVALWQDVLQGPWLQPTGLESRDQYDSPAQDSK